MDGTILHKLSIRQKTVCFFYFVITTLRNYKINMKITKNSRFDETVCSITIFSYNKQKYLWLKKYEAKKQ